MKKETAAEASSGAALQHAGGEELDKMINRDIVQDIAKDTAQKVRKAALAGTGNLAAALASARVRFKARELNRKVARVQRRIRHHREVKAALRPRPAPALPPMPRHGEAPRAPIAPSAAGSIMTQGVSALKGGGKILRWIDRELRVGDEELDLTKLTAQGRSSNHLQRHTRQLNRRVQKMSDALNKAKSKLAKFGKVGKGAWHWLQKAKKKQPHIDKSVRHLQRHEHVRHIVKHPKRKLVVPKAPKVAAKPAKQKKKNLIGMLMKARGDVRKATPGVVPVEDDGLWMDYLLSDRKG
jgi:hypothetical protein